MAQVIIRNLDERVAGALKRRAKLHGKSLEQELREVLVAAAGPTREELIEISQEIRSQARRPQRTDSTQLVREDRDDRILRAVAGWKSRERVVPLGSFGS